MSEFVDCIQRLRELSEELETLGAQLIEVETEFEPVDADYQKFMDDHAIGLWQRSQDDKDFKLPSEKLRIQLAHRAMEPALLGRHQGLLMSRGRIKERISSLKAQVEAQRSILSAMKEGMA